MLALLQLAFKLATRLSASASRSLQNSGRCTRRQSSQSDDVLAQNHSSTNLLRTSPTDASSTQKSLKYPPSCRSSYIGIREFFLSSSLRVQGNHGSFRSNRPRFSAPAHTSLAFSTTAKVTPNHFGAMENDWLQERDALASTFNPNHTPTPRFDWRMRAASRTRKDLTLAGEDVAKHDPSRRYLRRVAPPQINVQPGQPFYEEINAYSQRYALLSIALYSEVYSS